MSWFFECSLVSVGTSLQRVGVVSVVSFFWLSKGLSVFGNSLESCRLEVGVLVWRRRAQDLYLELGEPSTASHHPRRPVRPLATRQQCWITGVCVVGPGFQGSALMGLGAKGAWWGYFSAMPLRCHSPSPTFHPQLTCRCCRGFDSLQVAALTEPHRRWILVATAVSKAAASSTSHGTRAGKHTL